MDPFSHLTPPESQCHDPDHKNSWRYIQSLWRLLRSGQCGPLQVTVTAWFSGYYSWWGCRFFRQQRYGWRTLGIPNFERRLRHSEGFFPCIFVNVSNNSKVCFWKELVLDIRFQYREMVSHTVMFHFFLNVFYSIFIIVVLPAACKSYSHKLSSQVDTPNSSWVDDDSPKEGTVRKWTLS